MSYFEKYYSILNEANQTKYLPSHVMSPEEYRMVRGHIPNSNEYTAYLKAMANKNNHHELTSKIDDYIKNGNNNPDILYSVIADKIQLEHPKPSIVGKTGSNPNPLKTSFTTPIDLSNLKKNIEEGIKKSSVIVGRGINKIMGNTDGGDKPGGDNPKPKTPEPKPFSFTDYSTWSGTDKAIGVALLAAGAYGLYKLYKNYKKNNKSDRQFIHDHPEAQQYLENNQQN